MRLACWLAFLLSLPAIAETAEPVSAFVEAYCIQCHDADKHKGDFRIDTLAWDLAAASSREQWELVREYVSDGDIPPKKAKKHPASSDREAFVAALDAAFLRANEITQPGGTPVRRLNRVEYLNTVRDLFGFRMIKLPLSFPEDVASTEFDTMPDGLFLSPSVIDAYHESATNIADSFVPLPRSISYRSDLSNKTIELDRRRGRVGKGGIIKFTGFNMSGWVGAVWDPLFVAPDSGVYRVKLLANAQAETGADGKPLRLSFYAFDPTESELPKRRRIENTTRVAEVEIPTGELAWIECDVPMAAGETFHLYCANRFSPDVLPTKVLNRGQVNRACDVLKKRREPTVELDGMKIEGPVAVPPRTATAAVSRDVQRVPVVAWLADGGVGVVHCLALEEDGFVAMLSVSPRVSFDCLAVDLPDLLARRLRLLLAQACRRQIHLQQICPRLLRQEVPFGRGARNCDQQEEHHAEV